MSPADVSFQYALALREGATAGPPPAEAAELAETGATAVSGVWPEPTNPLCQIDGPVARLLKGLLPSPRDRDAIGDIVSCQRGYDRQRGDTKVMKLACRG